MLSRAGKPIALRLNEKTTEHAAFVQPAVREIMQQTGVTPHDIGCIAVANGPGSYTGLRVGLASAKGLCFAWNIPLITLSSLKLMAAALQDHLLHHEGPVAANALFTPMIDARRMEVFRAVYNHPQLDTIIEPGAEIITNDFLNKLLENNPVYFLGDGVAKWQQICSSKNAIFPDLPPIQNAFATLACHASKNNEWANLAYCEPFYTKAFHSLANTGK